MRRMDWFAKLEKADLCETKSMCFVGFWIASGALCSDSMRTDWCCMLVAGCGFRKLHIISWKTVRYLRIPNRLFSAFVKIRMSRMPILPIIGIEDIRFVIKSGIIIISPRTFNLNRVSHCSLRFYYTLHKTIACAWIGFVMSHVSCQFSPIRECYGSRIVAWRKRTAMQCVLGWKINFSMAFMLKNIFQYIKLEQLLVTALCNPAHS